jgi:hypothetical protein
VGTVYLTKGRGTLGMYNPNGFSRNDLEEMFSGTVVIRSAQDQSAFPYPCYLISSLAQGMAMNEPNPHASLVLMEEVYGPALFVHASELTFTPDEG